MADVVTAACEDRLPSQHRPGDNVGGLLVDETTRLSDLGSRR